MLRHFASLATSVSLCAFAASASAADAVVAADPTPIAPRAAVVADAAPRPAPPPVAPKGYTYYGWQSFIINGVGASMLAGAVALGDKEGATPLYVWGGIFYTLSPTIHLAHGKAGKAIGAAGVNVGLPITGLLLGTALGPKCEGDCIDGGRIGAIIGLLAAPVIDGLAFGWTRDDSDGWASTRGAVASRAAEEPTIGFAPMISSERVGVSVSGTF
jgi:hypothetical protein